VLPSVVKTVAKLAVLSLLAGLAMSAFGLRPFEVFDALGDAAGDVFRRAAAALSWAWRYILLGAAVVVPLWLALVVFRRLRQ
jgi:uncharacterized protein DUF6460